MIETLRLYGKMGADPEAARYRKEFETRPVARRLTLKLVRHAEPTVYGADESDLNASGITQAEVYAARLSEWIRGNLGLGTIVTFLHSNRERTKQSADIVEKHLRLILGGDGRKHVIALTTRQEEALTPDNTLDPVENHGIPRDKMYKYWIYADPDHLREIGAKTPEEVADDVDRLVKDSRVVCKAMGAGPELLYVAFTHETTLGAMLRKWFPQEDRTIDFCEEFEIELDLTHNLTIYRTRGQEVCVPGNNN